MKIGKMTLQFESQPPRPHSSSEENSDKRPKFGFIVTLLGAIIILIGGSVSIPLGAPEHGAVLIIMAIVNIYFGSRGYLALDKKGKKFNGWTLLFLGLIELIFSAIATWLVPSNIPNINLIVIVSGFPGGILTAISGVIISANK